MTKSRIDVGTLFGVAAVLSKGDPQTFAGLIQTFVIATQPVNRPYWQEMHRSDNGHGAGRIQLRDQRLPR